MQRILSSATRVCHLLTVCLLSGAVHSARAQQTSWCKITLQSERQDFGFVLCSQIHRGHPPSPSGAASSATGATGAPVRECKEFVDDLMEATGLKSGLLKFSADFLDAFNAGFRSLGREERAQVLAIVQGEFDASVLDAGVRRGLLNRCDPQTYASAFAALQTPLAVRMMKVEMEFTSPARAAERRSYAARLRNNPPPQERVALLQRLGQESGDTEFLIDLVVDIGVIFTSEFAGQMPTQAQIDAARAQVAPQARQVLLLSSLVIFRSVSDEDLEQYFSLWRSQPLREFNDTFRGVFQEVLQRQSRAAAAELKANIEARRSRSTSHR